MKKALLIGLLAGAIVNPVAAMASLNGKEDYSEPRVVAVSTSSTIYSIPWANASGYLYSPRIVFSAGHLKDNNELSQLYVSPPNQKLRDGLVATKVIKKFFPPTYRTKIYKDDFAILILEKPLLEIAPAPLITSQLLAQAIAEKSPMKQIGYGAYLDNCPQSKVKSKCQFSNGSTSLVPRSIEMIPRNAAEVKEKYNAYQAEVADHLFLTAPYKEGPCGGDSGGPTTVSIKGINYYVATVATGFWNAYACGQSGGSVGDSLGYTAPVYKFLDLIAEAEKYVAEHPYTPGKVGKSATPRARASVSPTKPRIGSDYQYIYKLAQQWASKSKAGDTALKQCTSARDNGQINVSGKAIALPSTYTNLRRDLNRYPGFNACLAGFLK
jgi:hypothetical protein